MQSIGGLHPRMPWQPHVPALPIMKQQFAGETVQSPSTAHDAPRLPPPVVVPLHAADCCEHDPPPEPD